MLGAAERVCFEAKDAKPGIKQASDSLLASRLSAIAIAGEVCLCCPGGTEPVQQHGCPGDASAAGAAEVAHPPCTRVFPG